MRGTTKEWVHTPVGFYHDIQQRPRHRTSFLQTKIQLLRSAGEPPFYACKACSYIGWQMAPSRMCSCGGDGTDKCDGTDTGQYGTVTMRNGNQPYPQDMLEAALM